jgi:hypothetical protein
MEDALTKIGQTDDLEAKLKADVLRTEHYWKNIKDAMFLSYSDGSVAERQARATQDPKTNEALEAYLSAVQAHREVENRRKREFTIVDVWRSENSARTKGVIT